MTAEAEIDPPTGLPKLSIELLPEEDVRTWDHSHFSQERFHRLPVIHPGPVDMANKVSAVSVCMLYVAARCRCLLSS